MKIYMKQIAPEYQDATPYFDFTEESEAGINIDGGRDFQSFLSEAYERAQKAYDDYDQWTVEYYFDGSIMQYVSYYLKKKNGKKFSTRQASEIKKLFESGEYFSDIVADMLTITEGEKYISRDIRDYYDCATVVCPERRSGEVEAIESYYFNTGEEYSIRIAEDDEDVTPDNFEDGDDVYSDYFTEWNDEQKKERIASEYKDVTAADVVIFSICGQYTYTKYEYAVA